MVKNVQKTCHNLAVYVVVGHFKTAFFLQLHSFATSSPGPFQCRLSLIIKHECATLLNFFTSTGLCLGWIQVVFFFQTNPTDISPDAIDITAICLPHSLRSIKHHKATWNNRRNFFQPDDDCYQCGPCEPGQRSNAVNCH